MPNAFGVCKGEAIDYHDNRSGQLDLMLYHRQSCAPVSKQAENVLLPCEGIYSVIEVKTTLTQDELDKAYVSAAKLRKLRPFKEKFVSSRTDGKGVAEGEWRCMYVIFAYDTNLSAEDWGQKEFDRAKKAAARRELLLTL